MDSDVKQGLARVLLVDDEELFLELTSKALTKAGCEVSTATSGGQALEELETSFFEVVVLDVRMPGVDGLTILRKLRAERPTQQVIMLTGQATVSMAIEAMKLGAFDFLLKPCSIDNLVRVIKHAAERGRLERRTIILEEELERTQGSGRIVGASEEIQKVHEFIEMAAGSNLPVLITGESGTGKELVARAIHNLSGRSSNPLVVVDGSILREELLASELFGHEKGAFTGAVRKKIGLFEMADRGTIFLDEIGELSPSNQGALLRVIEYGTFRPLGSVREVKTDVRIVTATNKNIKSAIASGEFREDLFYRLNALSIDIPPLRERRSDIELLAEYFLERWNTRTRASLKISKEAWNALFSYDWPGNIRELLYVIELSCLRALEEGEIRLIHLPEDLRQIEDKVPTYHPVKDGDRQAGWCIELPEKDLRLREFQDFCESIYIKRLLQRFDDNKSQVARIMGISRPMLYEKLRRLGIE